MIAAPEERIAPDRFTTIDGHRIRYRITGEGPVLVLCMGLGGNLEMFEPLQAHLAGFQTITFDYPGCGGSSDTWMPMTVGRYAGIAARLLEELRVASYDVLGYSFGGYVAQVLAASAPAVRRLVLVATTAGVPTIPPLNLNPLRLLSPLRYYSKTYYHRVAPKLFGGETARHRALADEQAERRAVHPPSVLGYWAQLGAATRYSGIPLLSKIHQPTLVLAGGSDRLVPTVNARVLARLVPRSTLVIMPDAGHLLLMDQPAEAAGHITAFLQ